MDAQKITQYLIEGHAAMKVPLDTIHVDTADLGRIAELLPELVAKRHAQMKVTYGIVSDGQYYSFEVTGADVLAGEAAVLAKVEAQLAAQLPPGDPTTQDTGGGTVPTNPK